ncbi:Arm DNA-binding domain-containing protein [Stutzerimonas stutzeri]|uniref:Arm DNA-binding domain-containing protein n=1 Tax=Stutzerimonas stutzeri TaxID=316 RepID=UPI0037225378
MTMEMPKGVEIHNGKVRISFMLNGKRQREVIRDMSVNAKTIAYAKSVRELVVDEIKRGVFDYHRRFPDSAKVTQTEAAAQVQRPLPVQPTTQPTATHSEPASTTMTVKEGVMLWLRVSKSDKASTTYLNYKCKAGHVIRYFGDTPIDRVTIQDLRLFRNHLVKPENGTKGLSPKTVNDILTVVRGVWADASANGLIANDHLKSIHNHKVKYKSLADPFTRAEIDRIRHSDPERLREARVVVMNCWIGLSRSELMGLAREDVDLDNLVIHVRRAYVDGIYRIPKEETRERFVELIKPAAELMKLILEDTAACKPQQIDVTQRDNLTSEQERVTFLFRDWTTDKAWNPDHLDEWFKEHLVKSKVNHRGINQCRHTFASQALSSHVKLEWLAKQLGHADTTMIKKHYAKLIPDDTKRMGSDVSEQMGFGVDWSGA